MIQMGMAAAFDFKRMLGTTALLGTGLAAATRFGGSGPAPARKKNPWGG